MAKGFVILLGVLVASLYIPPIVAPARHRELARRLATKSFIRRFSPVLMAIGIMAIIISDNSDLHHRILFFFGIYETLGGLYLLTFPGFAASQIQSLLSKSLKVWIVRGVLKFTLGLLMITWGVFFF